MSSKPVYQSKTLYFWHFVDDNIAEFNIYANLPFPVNEISISECHIFVDPGTIPAATHTPDRLLFKWNVSGSDEVIGSAFPFHETTNGITSSPITFTPTRYVFPPDKAIMVGGTYQVKIQRLRDNDGQDQNIIPHVFPNNTDWIASFKAEFIQHDPTPFYQKESLSQIEQGQGSRKRRT